MRLASFIAGAAAVTTIGLTAPVALAADAPLFGVSVDGYVAPTWDRSVTDMQSGKPYQPSRGAVGLATLLSWDELVLGGVADGTPGIFGDGRLTMGGLFGWQPRSGSDRYQLLAELGEERFSDTGGNVRPSVPDTTLGYVGARLGMTHTFGIDSPFELGVWAFVRRDIGESTVTNVSGNVVSGEDTITQYRVGGFSGGVSLRIGLRFEQKRPTKRIEAEPQPARI